MSVKGGCLCGALRYEAAVGPAFSGQPIDRVFCPVCGTSICSRPRAMAGMLMVLAGTLDDASAVTPGMSIYASRAQAWDPPSKAIPAFPEMPPAA